MTGAAKMNESTRSSMPPCPGMSVPESLAPAARLMTDSARSPAWAASATSGPEKQGVDRVLAKAPQHRPNDDRADDDPADDALDGLCR